MKAPRQNKVPSAWQLQRVIALAQATVESLRSDHGVILDTDAAIAAALAEEQVDVGKILRRLVDAQIAAEVSAKFASERMADLKIRIARYKRQDTALRDTIADVLAALEVKSWPDPEFSLTLSPGQRKVLISEAKDIPAHLTVTVPATTEPDLPRVKAALEAGEAVPGASLSNGSTILTIRTK